MNLNHLLGSRSDFSIGESMLQIDHLIADAKALGYESVTLMDTMSIHGLVDFTNKCKKAGLKPIIGCRIRVVEDPTYRKPPKASGEKEKPNPMFMLKVYVTGDKGVTSLMKLLSKAYSEDYFYYHARVGLDEIMELEEVIISTGDLFSIYHREDASIIIDVLQDYFGKGNVYSELVPIDTPGLRTLRLDGDADAIGAVFDDIAQLSPLCRFRDCRHLAEPGCALVAAEAAGTVSARRLASYRRLAEENIRLKRPDWA